MIHQRHPSRSCHLRAPKRRAGEQTTRSRCNPNSLVIGFAIVASFIGSTAQAERWTALGGTKTIDAKMIGLWGDSVVLQLDGGRRVTVNLLNLQAESRIQAQELARKQVTFRETIVGEIKSAAEEAAAPAPTPLPEPPPAATYVPFKSGMSVIDQLEWSKQQQQAGHIIAAFDALPPKYQADIEQLAKTAAAKIDAATLQSIISSIHQIGDVIVTKQRWVFSHPRFAAMEDGSADAIKEMLLPVAGLIRVGLDPKAFDLAAFQSTPFRSWLMQRDQAMAPYIAELNELSGAANLLSFQLKGEKDGVATVEVTMGTVKTLVQFIAVDGHWVEKASADEWDKSISEQTQQLADTPNGSYLAGGMTSMIPDLITPMVNPMAQATTAEEMHVAMDPVFDNFVGPAVGTLMAVANMSTGPGRGNNNPYGYNDGAYDSYSSGYGEEGMGTGMEAMNMESYGESYGQSQGGSGPSSSPPTSDSSNGGYKEAMEAMKNRGN
ncbi:hypothetical protein [Stieleria varia]|nr:hypothetical protein [Stieleria varia]